MNPPARKNRGPAPASRSNGRARAGEVDRVDILQISDRHLETWATHLGEVLMRESVSPRLNPARMADELREFRSRIQKMLEGMDGVRNVVASLDNVIRLLGAVGTNATDEDEKPTKRTRSIRPGSKRDRIRSAVVEFIQQNGPTHIDDLLDPIDKLGLFEGVKDKKISLGNYLSQLRAAGFLVSDYHGIWSLANSSDKGEAA